MSTLLRRALSGALLSHRSLMMFAICPNSEIPTSLTEMKGECRTTPPTRSPSSCNLDASLHTGPLPRLRPKSTTLSGLYPRSLTRYSYAHITCLSTLRSYDTPGDVPYPGYSTSRTFACQHSASLWHSS